MDETKCLKVGQYNWHKVSELEAHYQTFFLVGKICDKVAYIMVPSQLYGGTYYSLSKILSCATWNNDHMI